MPPRDHVRVLLVDDAPDLRGLLRLALGRRGGFDIVGEAATGTEAVELAAAHRPDVVVLDLGLPDLAGEEVISRIRACAREAKIVIFSGDGPHDRAWFAERAEGYVIKGARLDILVDLLEQVAARPVAHAELDLPADLSSVSSARAFLHATLRTWGVAAIAEDALVVVSELVTNAITHAASGCIVRVDARDRAVRIAVVDHGEGTPNPQPFSATRGSGRGLHIVGALAQAWGVDELADGKVVWAEMARDVDEVS